jgi:hypothetical protein
MQTIRLLLLIEGVAFGVASLTHFGVLTSGYEHQKAGTAESVIAGVLLAGLVGSLLWPAFSRTIGLAVQAFALLGTFVGIFMIVIGVGPRTAPDIVFHVCIVIMLLAGLIATARARWTDGRVLPHVRMTR